MTKADNGLGRARARVVSGGAGVMRIVALLVLAVCAVVAALIYLPALVARGVADALAAIEWRACARIAWAVDRLRQ